MTDDHSIDVNSVWSDMNTVRAELAEHVVDVTAINSINAWRPVLDTIFDIGIIFLTILCAFRNSFLTYPIALCIIGNRQRALGNLLHEASHKNLFKAGKWNDWFAIALLAPPLISDLNLYRKTHARHHALLGQKNKDPDLIAPILGVKNTWWHVYRHQFFSPPIWISSVFGHLHGRRLTWNQGVWIGMWWIALFALLTTIINLSFAIFFIALWFSAKATIFHAITIFREMCDHFSLKSGGIYSFTRDTVIKQCWREIIHPHNNGYHLSHHLMPSIPYYRLPEAQKLLSQLPSYIRNAIVCESYLMGDSAVVRKRFRVMEKN